MPVKGIRHLEEQTLKSTFCSHSLRTTSRWMFAWGRQRIVSGSCYDAVFLNCLGIIFYEMQWVVFPPVLSFAMQGFFFFLSDVVPLLNFLLVSEPCKDDIEICCRKKLFHSARPPPDFHVTTTGFKLKPKRPGPLAETSD